MFKDLTQKESLSRFESQHTERFPHITAQHKLSLQLYLPACAIWGLQWRKQNIRSSSWNVSTQEFRLKLMITQQ